MGGYPADHMPDLSPSFFLQGWNPAEQRRNGHAELPGNLPVSLLQWIGKQLRIDSSCWAQYAEREETRRGHLLELRAYLGVCVTTTKTAHENKNHNRAQGRRAYLGFLFRCSSTPDKDANSM